MPAEAPQPQRLFIAVLIPEEVKAEIEKAQTQLRGALPTEAVRWVKPEQFHLTLRFLGSVESARVQALTDAVRTAAQNFGALRLRAETIGCFPDARFPRVVWAGVADAAQELPRLQATVQTASQEFTAEQAEDRFTGHVTLGRIKRIRRPEAEALAKVSAPMAHRLFGEWMISEIHIMQSQLSPHGARYSILARIPLS